MTARNLIRYLATKQAIVAKLSIAKFGTRLFARRAPQGCPLPLVVVTALGGAPEYHLTGEIGDLARTFQVDVYADSEDECEEIAELIRLAPLSGYRGQMDGVRVHAVTIQSEDDPTEQRGDGNDAPYYRSRKDYRIHFDRVVN